MSAQIVTIVEGIVQEPRMTPKLRADAAGKARAAMRAAALRNKGDPLGRLHLRARAADVLLERPLGNTHMVWAPMSGALAS
jgi:hypothetical protein